MTQPLAPVDNRIRLAATEVVKSSHGENIRRVAEEVARKVDGVSVDQAVRVIDRDWAQITADAGLGPLRINRATAGLRAPNDQAVRQALTAQQLAAVGTIQARQHTKGSDTFVVQGPQYWDLMGHTKPFETSGTGRAIDRTLKTLHLDGAREKLGYDMTKMVIDHIWSTGDKAKAARGISGTEIEALTRPGPNGEPAVLQPGDVILCGGGGDGGLTHSILYAGIAPSNHPNAGQPMIIHSMATLREGSSKVEWFADKLGNVSKTVLNVAGLDEKTDFKTGVLYERLGDFFNRYHRDSIMIMRDPTLTPEMIQRGIAHVREFTGYDEATGKIDLSKRVPYDYKLAPDDLVTRPQRGDTLGRREYLAKYCTEVWLAFDYAAHDRKREELPYVGTAYYSMGSPFGTLGVYKTFVAEPEDLAVSPSLQTVAYGGFGEEAFQKAARLRFQPPGVFGR